MKTDAEWAAEVAALREALREVLKALLSAELDWSTNEGAMLKRFKSQWRGELKLAEMPEVDL